MSMKEKIKGWFAGGRGGHKEIVLCAPLTGRVVPLSEVKDETFASKILGDGVAVMPIASELRAPVDGSVEQAFESGHAVTLVSDEGVELLLHIGIDTVELKGKHFDMLVRAGDRVKQGQVLIRFDKEAIGAAGYDVTTPMVIGNSELFEIDVVATGDVGAGCPLLRLKRKDT